MIAGRKAGLSHKASTNIGLTLVSRGEFSIIVANIGIAGGLMAAIKPFSALYVLILASLGPLLTKGSGRIYSLLDKVFKWSAKERAKREKKLDSINKGRLHELHVISLFIVTAVVFVGKSIYFQTAINIISFTDKPLSEFHQLLISCLPI